MRSNHKHQIARIIFLTILLLPLSVGARWISVDPLASKYPSISPYVYALNNPLKFIDPDGRDAFLFTWAPKGGDVGHSATGTQIRDDEGNPTGEVRARHLWPENPVGKGLTAPADYRKAVVNESNLSSFQGGEGRPPDAILRIQGDAAQDQTLNAALDQAEANPTYHAETNSCATYTATGLKAIGLDTGTGGKVTANVLGFPVSRSNVTTPVSVHNAVSASGGSRVSNVIKLPSELSSPNIEIH